MPSALDTPSNYRNLRRGAESGRLEDMITTRLLAEGLFNGRDSSAGQVLDLAPTAASPSARQRLTIICSDILSGWCSPDTWHAVSFRLSASTVPAPPGFSPTQLFASDIP